MSLSESFINDLLESIVEEACNKVRIEKDADESSSICSGLSSLSPASGQDSESPESFGGPLNDNVLKEMVSTPPKSDVENIGDPRNETGHSSPITHHQGTGNGWLPPKRLFDVENPHQYGGHPV